MVKMNKHLKNYFNSFKFEKEYRFTLLFDGVFLLIMVVGLYLFNLFITQKAYSISNGKSTDDIKQMLLSMDPVQAQAFLATLKSFIFVFTISSIILIVGGLFLYSFTRQKVWNYLTKHKSKYWKWNVLNLVLILPLLIYLIIFGLVRLVSTSLFQSLKNQWLASFLNALVSLFFLMMFVIFIFLVYYEFSKKNEVWNSIGQAFEILKKRWYRIWPLFLLGLITSIFLSILFWPISKIFATYSVSTAYWLYGLSGGLITFLFMVWLRIYLFRTIKE